MTQVVGKNLVRDEATLQRFELLLKSAKDKLSANPPKESDKKNFWETFENDVHAALDKSRDGVPGTDKWEIEYIPNSHKFPDIVAHVEERKSLGVEVKTISTKNNSWKIMGGSIMESTRIPDVSRIHVFCARQKPFEIKYRPFEDCVENVAVTHSPRYMLNMELEKSLFSALNTSYDKVRKMRNPFDAFKDYVAKNQKTDKENENSDFGLWWYSPKAEEFSAQDLVEEKFANSLVNNNVLFWKKLPQKSRAALRIETIIACPSVIAGEYENACNFLLQRRGVVCASFRDIYSAGGKDIVEGAEVPRIIVHLSEWSADIAEAFSKMEGKKPLSAFHDWAESVMRQSKFSETENAVLKKVLYDRIELALEKRLSSR